MIVNKYWRSVLRNSMSKSPEERECRIFWKNLKRTSVSRSYRPMGGRQGPYDKGHLM